MIATNPLRPFSIRHRQAIFDRKLTVSVPMKLRQKIVKLLQYYDHEVWVNPDPLDSSWGDRSCVAAEVKSDLERAYGEDQLTAFTPPDSKTLGPVDWQGFVLGAYPSKVLDSIEVFQSYLTEEKDWKLSFQRDINQAFEDERCPWRLSDGRFFKVDSEFLAAEVLEKAQELLKTEGFHGPLEEFREARGDLAGGDHKGAIVNACKAFESTLKAVLGRDDGNARDLLAAFVAKGYCNDIPEATRSGFRDQVLQALPFVRNKLGGHGQGSGVVDVPRAYAELAVHLSGCFVQFVINRATSGTPLEDEPAFPDDDDDPF